MPQLSWGDATHGASRKRTRNFSFEVNVLSTKEKEMSANGSEREIVWERPDGRETL